MHVDATQRMALRRIVNQPLESVFGMVVFVQNVLDVVDRIPGVAAQLKLLSMKMDKGHYCCSNEVK